MIEVHHDVIGPDQPDRRSGRWLHLSAWVVALVVFEVTADPSLVVVVGCSKFGWAQLRAARWLRRNDPNTRRGKACRWFYVSWGLWRISLVAALLMYVVIYAFLGLQHALGVAAMPGDTPPAQFITAALIVMFGLVSSTLTSIVGVTLALRSRVRIWVGQAGLDAFRSGTWPPVGSAAGRNWIGSLLITTVPIAFVLAIFPMAAMVIVAEWWGIRAVAGEGAGGLAAIAGTLAAGFGGAVSFMYFVAAAKHRVQAHSPTDCWGSQEATPPPSNQITFGNALR